MKLGLAAHHRALESRDTAPPRTHFAGVGHFVDAYRLGLALHLNRAHSTGGHVVGNQPVGVLRHQEAPRLCQGLHPRRNVRGVAEGGVHVQFTRPQVPNDDQPGVDPGSNLDGGVPVRGLADSRDDV